jgi:hypothetical protein
MGLYDRDYMQQRSDEGPGRRRDPSASGIESALAAFWARHPRLPVALAAGIILIIALVVVAVIFG